MTIVIVIVLTPDHGTTCSPHLRPVSPLPDARLRLGLVLPRGSSSVLPSVLLLKVRRVLFCPRGRALEHHSYSTSPAGATPTRIRAAASLKAGIAARPLDEAVGVGVDAAVDTTAAVAAEATVAESANLAAVVATDGTAAKRAPATDRCTTASSTAAIAGAVASTKPSTKAASAANATTIRTADGRVGCNGGT